MHLTSVYLSRKISSHRPTKRYILLHVNWIQPSLSILRKPRVKKVRPTNTFSITLFLCQYRPCTYPRQIRLAVHRLLLIQPCFVWTVRYAETRDSAFLAIIYFSTLKVIMLLPLLASVVIPSITPI